jgi:molybdopterin-synthase adenylyltransferase
MDDEALTRYSRHILLNEWGVEAQARLSRARVLIIGVGGLGCPAAQLLAAAGVGQLTLVDDDTVDATNLQRQHLHNQTRIGMAKVLSAQAALLDINPLVHINPVQERLAGQALLDAVAAHDVVLDCSDNFATRHAVNRACVLAAKPLVSGAAIRFDGQFIVFNAADSSSACYHCLFPEHGEDDQSDRCAVMGVFAPLTMQVGTLQASAAIRWLAGVGQVKHSQLTIINALSGSEHTMSVPKDKVCSVCSVM